MSDIREHVRERYAAAAERATTGDTALVDEPCCGSDCCGGAEQSFGAKLYADRPEGMPETAFLASLGCGNPTEVASLEAGDVVLDLGSGGGLDSLLSARRVGPGGYVYGIDMTDEMLELARKNAAEAGVANVEFRKGYIEDLPLPDASIDVAISNCVINLSADKPAVFAEIHRVLKPGGRIGVSDVVASDELSPVERMERGSWVGCIAGALSFEEYRRGLESAGFEQISVTPTHEVAPGMHSAIVHASKPV